MSRNIASRVRERFDSARAAALLYSAKSVIAERFQSYMKDVQPVAGPPPVEVPRFTVRANKDPLELVSQRAACDTYVAVENGLRCVVEVCLFVALTPEKCCGGNSS